MSGFLDFNPLDDYEKSMAKQLSFITKPDKNSPLGIKPTLLPFSQQLTNSNEKQFFSIFKL